MVQSSNRIRSLRRLACSIEARRRHDEAELLRRQAGLQALARRIEDLEVSSRSSVMLGVLGAASIVKWTARLRSEFDEQQGAMETLRIRLLRLFQRQRLIEILERTLSQRAREMARAEDLAALTERESAARFAQDSEG